MLNEITPSELSQAWANGTLSLREYLELRKFYKLLPERPEPAEMTAIDWFGEEENR